MILLFKKCSKKFSNWWQKGALIPDPQGYALGSILKLGKNILELEMFNQNKLQTGQSWEEVNLLSCVTREEVPCCHV